MRQNAIWAIIIALTLCSLAMAVTPRERVPRPIPYSGSEEVVASPGVVHHGPVQTLDDTIRGTRRQIGSTWFDYQSNGTMGKQVAVDAEGWVQHAWTKGQNSGSTLRHVFYNAFEPTLDSLIADSGQQADASQKAGFTGIGVNAESFGFPVFHQVLQSNAHSAAAIDFMPRLGAFSPVQIPPIAETRQIIWPHIDVDVNGNLHTVHTENGGTAHNYYARGVPNTTDGTITWSNLQDWGPTTFVTVDVVTALHSPRVATAWIMTPDTSRPGDGDNIFMRISEDGGLNWGQNINVTNFTPVDTACLTNGGTVEECDKDTLRPWVDLSIIFDENDNIHIAFSTSGWYYWFPGDSSFAPGPWTFTDRRSEIWHWSEATDAFSLVAERWYGAEPGTNSPGTNQLMCHRPSLGVDTVTHNLYCSYQLFDTSQYSDVGYLQADAYVSVSTNGGLQWAEGTGVVVTRPAVIPSPAGQAMHERDICIAKLVTDGRIHMQYTLDHDAGSSNFEGTPTLNEVYDLEIPVDSVATTPLMPVRALRWDSTGYPNLAVDDRPNLKPGEFTLFQNYPNPFNPTTTLQFDLASESVITLGVYDVLGRQVATLCDRARLSAGVHVMSFDASGLASGVYFYRLQSPKFSQTRKMVVMK